MSGGASTVCVSPLILNVVMSDSLWGYLLPSCLVTTGVQNAMTRRVYSTAMTNAQCQYAPLQRRRRVTARQASRYRLRGFGEL
jgi:hypothetical protein